VPSGGQHPVTAADGLGRGALLQPAGLPARGAPGPEGRLAAPRVFVQHAVGVALDDVAGWGAMLADALGDTGGELSAQERRWADEVLGLTKPGRSPAA
jgi:hypothetical protein